MLNNKLTYSVAFAFCFTLFGENDFFSEEKSVKVNISMDDMRSDNVHIKQIRKINKKLPFKTAKIAKRFLSSKPNKVKHSTETKMTNNYVINVQEFKSESGIKIRFVKRPDSEIVTLNAAFLNRGDIFETIPGIVRILTTSINLSDTEKYSYEQISQTCQAKGINLTVRDSNHTMNVTLQYVSNYKDSAVEILKELIYRSKLNAVALAKTQLIDRYNDAMSDPVTRLSIKMDAAMFPNHPYGETTTDKDYAKIDASIVEKAYSSSFSRDNLLVVVVGNFNSCDDVSKLIDDIFGDLPESSSSDMFKTDIKKIEPSKFATINEPQVGYRNNKIFYTMNNTPEINSKEAAALKIAVTAFSGIPLECRLINSLRKKLGKVYYARFNVIYEKFSSYFKGSTESSDYENTKSAIIDAIDEFKNTGITKEEFNYAIRYILSAHVFDIVDGKGIANGVLGFWLYGFDKDFINSYYEQIKNATLEDVQKVIQKYFNKDNISFGVITKDESQK